MKLTLVVLSFVLMIVPLAACAPPGDARGARQTLIEFFDHLASDEYDQAVDLYGGDYEELILFAPEIDHSNRSELWRSACNTGSLQCLPVAAAVLKGQAAGTLTFTVEFRTPDGGIFTLGPCCGATATEMPPTSQFDIRVQRTSRGTFVVLDMPIYVP